MSKLQVYWVNDGRDEFIMMVAAKNQKEACRLLDCTLYYHRNHGGRWPVPKVPSAAIALSEPGRVFKRKTDLLRAPHPWLYADA